MNCETFKTKLDAYIDAEMNESEIGEMLEHANHCAACAEELRIAEALRDALEHMDGETAVPLQAQAAWRDAVRKEAGKRASRRRLRFVYAAAAAVVVLLGCTAALKSAAPKPELALEMARLPMIEAAEGSRADMAAEPMTKAAGANVAADGMAAQSAFSTPTTRRRIRTGDLEAAKETLAALCAEYGANIAYERASDGAWICGVEISADSAEELLNAAGQIGTTIDTAVLEEAPETALIEFEIQEE